MGFATRARQSLTGDQLSYVQDRRDQNVNVGSVERWASMVAGSALAGYALKHRSASGGLAALASAVLLYRGATGHCHAYDAAGLNTATHNGGKGTGRIAGQGSDTRERLGGSAGVIVEESVTIRRAVSDVFRFWRRLENLPRFMHHLESVTVNPDGTSRWVVKGPAGIPVTWDARVINEVEDSVIGWQSLEGAMVATAGSVNFARSGSDSTTVRVRFQYDPPAGKLGARVAEFLGEDPAATVREDLDRLKELLEQGSSSTTDARYSPAPPTA